MQFFPFLNLNPVWDSPIEISKSPASPLFSSNGETASGINRLGSSNLYILTLSLLHPNHKRLLNLLTEPYYEL